MQAATLLVLSLVPAAPALKEKPAPPPLHGRWTCIALNINGRPDQQWQGLEYEFTPDGKWIIYRNGKVLDDRERTYLLDAKAGPQAIDLTEGPQPQVSAFRVEKDTLQLAIRTANGDRPATPDATGDGLMTFTFQRVKAGK